MPVHRALLLSVPTTLWSLRWTGYCYALLAYVNHLLFDNDDDDVLTDRAANLPAACLHRVVDTLACAVPFILVKVLALTRKNFCRHFVLSCGGNLRFACTAARCWFPALAQR